MPRRNRPRRPGRRSPFKESRPVILIVAEGSNTEPQYLKSFRNACQNPRVSIEVVGGAGVPRTIVHAAKERKESADVQAERQGDDNLRFDQVWCVFDVDDHPEVSNSIEMARANGMKVAVSNPSFELWLLLHFRDQPGMQDRSRIRSMLQTYVPGYDKDIEFETLQDGYCDAVRRAKRLQEDADNDNESYRNPTTGVWRLTERIQFDT